MKSMKQSLNHYNMDMTYTDAVSYLSSAPKFRETTDKSTLLEVLKILDNPEKHSKFIHVAGTNGKGSTCTFIHSIIKSAGYKVGLFTSPSLKFYNQRIVINNSCISDKDFIKYMAIIKEVSSKIHSEEFPPLLEFEILTIMALCYFKDSNCDIVVLEVGIGGKEDSTNIIPTPLVSVITNIGLDHTGYLGNTLKEIAQNKAGIIKPSPSGVESSVVLYNQCGDVTDVVKSQCSKSCSRLITAYFDEILINKSSIYGQCFDYKNYKNLSIKLIGSHQINNAVVALETIISLRDYYGFTIDDNSIKLGLSSSYIPARMELISDKPIIFIDGAHNVQGITTLTENIQKLLPNTKIVFLIGILADKDYKDMITPLLPFAKEILTITPPSPRGLSGDILSNYITENSHIPSRSFSDVSTAMKYGATICTEDSGIIVCGSFSFLGDNAIEKYRSL